MKEQGCFNGGFSGFIVVLVYYYPSRDFGAPKMEVAFKIQTKLVQVPPLTIIFFLTERIKDTIRNL